MDNATRRQLLEQARQVGYTGSILDVFQNPQVLDQFAQEQQVQQQAQVQQPQQQMQVEMPTPPATTPNYKVTQPRQSEAQPLVMSNTEVPIQIRKTGGKVNSCPTGYIWSDEQNRCIPMASVSGYIPQNYDPNTTLNKSLENSQKQGWDIPQLGMEAVGAMYPALSRPLSAIGAVSDVVNKNPIGYVGNMLQLVPHPVAKIAGTVLSVGSATPVGAALNAEMLEKPVYHHQPLETPRQALDRFAVPDNTNQPVFVPKNTKKKFDKGGPKQREVVYTNPEEFKIANQAYQDSTTTAGTTANLLYEIDRYNRNAWGAPPTGAISKAQYANIFAGVHTGVLPVSHSTLFTTTPSGSRQPWQVAHYKSPKTKPILQEAPQRIEPLPMQKLPVTQPQLEPVNLNLNIQPQRSRDVYQSDYTMKTGQRLTGRMRFNPESKKWESRPIDQEELDYYNDKNRIDSMKESVETPTLKKSPGVMRFDNGGPTDPPKKQIKRASDEELMFGMRPTVAVQDNTYVTTPRIEEAKRDDAKGVTPQQKQKAATTKKKIVAEEKRQQLVDDLSNQGTISPATEGTERLKNQFIYAMDQPLDAMGSLMQRGYVPQGNLNGDYETASPMSSVIGAFNPLSAVMDVARVGRDLGEKETYTTLSGAGELGLHALGILPSVQLGKQLGKKAIKEAVYWGVEPIGYGVKQKLAYLPANLIKYGYHGLQGNATKVKLKTLESIMDNYDKMGGAIVQGRPYKYEAFKDGIRTLYNPKGSRGYEREAQRRLDAWNTTWNKDQLFDTFTKIGENKYVLNAAKYNMDPEQLNSIVSDVEANKLNRLFKKNQISPEEYDASLKALTLKQSWDPQYANASIESIKSSILKNPENFKDIYHYDPIRKGGATSGYLKDEGYTDVVSASDEFGVRGGFLYHTKPNPDGTIHLRAHDTWDFNPWAKRGQIRNVENENARKYNNRNVINMLKDIDPIQMLGGKPYDIENNYIFDPVTRKIMASYKTGGKKCYTCDQSKLQVLYNKRNYKK